MKYVYAAVVVVATAFVVGWLVMGGLAGLVPCLAILFAGWFGARRAMAEEKAVREFRRMVKNL